MPKDFKLVLLDLIMPVMDGYQVLAVMKEKQWLDMLPVICISSEASEIASVGFMDWEQVITSHVPLMQ